jgi:hypothetical protein
MANDAHGVFWCLNGDSKAFGVTTPVNANIDEVKKPVKKKSENGAFLEIDTADLMIWKVP